MTTIRPSQSTAERNRRMPQVADNESRPEVRPRYLNPILSIVALNITERATNGDPEALHTILSSLRVFLRGKGELPVAYAGYLEDVLGSILGESELWSDAASSFQEESRKGTEEQRLLGRGPRVPEKLRRRFGTLFCRAFRISKPQGKDYEKHQEHLTPEVVWKVHLLQKLGATRARAIKIVKSARPQIRRHPGRLVDGGTHDDLVTALGLAVQTDRPRPLKIIHVSCGSPRPPGL